MMDFKYDACGSMSFSELAATTSEIVDKPQPAYSEAEALRLILSCIDLTTLDGNDNLSVVRSLCMKALALQDEAKEIQHVAAVCLYSNFIMEAKQQLAGSGIKVACVAGGFPSGQGLLRARTDDVKFAAEAGTDEIDIVFPRGLLFAGEFEQAADEIAAMRNACQGLTLKVILESGEMKDPLLISRAAEISIRSGADFIKTSTGKTSVGATPEAVFVMLQVIRQHNKETGSYIGLKPSGGVGEPDMALQFLRLVEATVGDAWLNPGLFRIGASRLADKIFEKLT